MELIPAIDLLGGRVVRLSKGAYDAVIEYGDDPVAVARGFEGAGAARIHIVDLDAAREGRAMQANVIASIVAAVDVPCQVAGGIRDADAVAAGLRAGADRLVLGSALISSPLLARTLTERYGPDRIVSALDVRDGQALGDGWVEGARGAEVIELAQTLAEKGVRWFAVTAIARDGQMNGPDFELLEAVRAAVPGAAIIASGGVSSLADIRELRPAASTPPSRAGPCMRVRSRWPKDWRRQPADQRPLPQVIGRGPKIEEIPALPAPVM